MKRRIKPVWTTMEVMKQGKMLNEYLKDLNNDKAKFYGGNTLKKQEGVEVQRTKK